MRRHRRACLFVQRELKGTGRSPVSGAHALPSEGRRSEPSHDLGLGGAAAWDVRRATALHERASETVRSRGAGLCHRNDTHARAHTHTHPRAAWFDVYIRAPARTSRMLQTLGTKALSAEVHRTRAEVKRQTGLWCAHSSLSRLRSLASALGENKSGLPDQKDTLPEG